MSVAPGLRESHIQQTVTEFMKLDGWTAIRTHPIPPILQRLDAIMLRAPIRIQTAWCVIRVWLLKHTDKESFGEPGQADYLFMRAGFIGLQAPLGHIDAIPMRFGMCTLMWIEFKAPGKNPTPEQIAWHDEMRARGFAVYVVDDIDDYIDWYKRESGLNLRAL